MTWNRRSEESPALVNYVSQFILDLWKSLHNFVFYSLNFSRCAAQGHLFMKQQSKTKNINFLKKILPYPIAIHGAVTCAIQMSWPAGWTRRWQWCRVSMQGLPWFALASHRWLAVIRSPLPLPLLPQFLCRALRQAWVSSLKAATSGPFAAKASHREVFSEKKYHGNLKFTTSFRV